MKCNYHPYKSKLTKEEKELFSALIARHAFPIAFNRDYVAEAAYSYGNSDREQEGGSVCNDSERNEGSDSDR